MLNQNKHQQVMTAVIKDIYSDTTLGPLLGFKGGTAAYFFYDLPRFSVDLDFDLLRTNPDDGRTVMEKINKILLKHGTVKDSHNKYFTIFSLLSYDEKGQNVKIEISARKLPYDIRKRFVLNERLGMPLLVAKKDYMYAGKLSAFLNRKKFAIRDLFDLNYYLKNTWDLDEDVLKYWTNRDLKQCLADCIGIIENIKDNEMLVGIGELITDQQKEWVKKSLRSDTIFYLKNYLTS